MRSAFIMKTGIDREKLDWGFRSWLTRTHEDHANTLVVVEVDLLPGFGHDFHIHPEQDELVYVLQGKIEQWLGTEKRVLSVNDSAFIEKNTVHASFNASNGPAKVLAILAPTIGTDGYEVVEVAHEAPWNEIREESRNGISESR